MQRGFTLVEVLVALAVFGMLAAGGVTMLRFTLDNQAATAARLERLADFERARALLAADLSQAADRPTRGLDGLTWPPFTAASAGDQGMVFTLVRRGWENPDAAPRPSLRYVEYAIVEGRLERRARAMPDGSPLGEPMTLLTGVSDVRVETAFGAEFQPVDGVYRGAVPRAVALLFTVDGYGPIRLAFLVAGPT